MGGFPWGGSMQLRKLWIKHFRSCHDVSIDIGNLHAFVGANSAGKSTILHALDLLFNASTSKLTEESFTKKDTSTPISIEGC
jgi:predicted ATP-dependent endonuclease of OLD family